MKNILKTSLLITLFVANALGAAGQKSGSTSYKCMLQMTNYMGEGAYVAVSLINPKGIYEKTVQVLGSNKKWYVDLKEWYKFQKEKPADISAITGASVAGGDRSVTVFEIENSKIDAGYTLRFESAVENQEYHIKDVEFPLTTESVSGKTDGTGYIRYVRLIPN